MHVYIINKPGFICSGSPARVIRYTIYCPTCEAGRVVYGIKPDQREGFILSISKDLLIISFNTRCSCGTFTNVGLCPEKSFED